MMLFLVSAALYVSADCPVSRAGGGLSLIVPCRQDRSGLGGDLGVGTVLGG